MIPTPQQKLKLSSRPENLILLEKLVEDVCDIYNIGEEKFGNILISLTEAVNNAMVHGNKSNPGKNIDICLKSNIQEIKFIVCDQGEGFDFTCIPDPTAPENLEKENGRGVFLMKQLADKVEFAENGRIVELTFQLN